MRPAARRSQVGARRGVVNILGDLWEGGEPDWSTVLAVPDARLHLYGKREPRRGRKMGHYTCLADNAVQAGDAALRIQRA